jgi:sodium transport system permease protein
MRWSIIRLIWHRELRDQLRDRRTIFMIAILPILVYPVAGFGIMQLFVGLVNRPSVVGVQGAQYLPPQVPAPGPKDYPPLLVERDGEQRFPDRYLESFEEGRTRVVLVGEGEVPSAGRDNSQEFLDGIDRGPLLARQVDVLLVVPADFTDLLEKAGRPPLFVLTREGEEHGRLVEGRLRRILDRWKKDLKDVRLRRAGLPENFDDPFEVQDEARARPAGKKAAEELFDLLVRIFPFVLVMWSLAGALYPAVDLCAGEKERGTMETLLISPASREEIVWGKFLTIWVFSAATALLNLLSMGLTTWLFSPIPHDAFRASSLLWGVVLLLPLSAFFSAVCLAVGAYARSSKEGQYYLMPLFLVTMPLIFLTLAPGVELNPFYSMVPVTGVALLLQKLMAPTPDRGLWMYFVPVLAPMVIYGWLALRWAIEQFQREEVLFREAERLDLKLWLQRLFREKEELPSAGEALFCFGLILGLMWLAAGLGSTLSLKGNAVRYLAFVAAPPLLMAILLTTRPAGGLALRLPPAWAVPAAILQAVLLFPAATALTVALLSPEIKQSLEEAARLASASTGGSGTPHLSGSLRIPSLLVLAVLPALCEELAFRGFILSGLRRRFRPWTAIFLSSFLYALYQMNVFQCLPHFLAGVVLAILALRTRSVWPAVAFHLVWNFLLLGPLLYPDVLGALGQIEEGVSGAAWLQLLVVGGSLVLALPLLWAVWHLGSRPASETSDTPKAEDKRPMEEANGTWPNHVAPGTIVRRYR